MSMLTTPATEACECPRRKYLHRHTSECPPPEPFHRWAINEDPTAPSVHVTSTGRPDHCLVCGIVRYPLVRWARQVAAGPCPGPHYRAARRR